MVARVLRRAGLNRLARLDAPPVIQRYDWPHAGDLLHLDIKPLACIRHIGDRIHGDRSRSHPGAGHEYAHVAMTRRAWPTSRSAARNAAGPARPF